MTRLIDADEFLKEIAAMDKWCYCGSWKWCMCKERQFVISEVIKKIESAPTVRGDNPSPWIPVTERLPEEGRVLTARWNEIHYSRFRLGKFLIDVEPLTYRETYPTHWMPLPNPPTE